MRVGAALQHASPLCCPGLLTTHACYRHSVVDDTLWLELETSVAQQLMWRYVSCRAWLSLLAAVCSFCAGAGVGPLEALGGAGCVRMKERECV